ncbi:MAG: D-alanyl-D-alanine carboxypeptidase [Desulfovibrio sp.]|nr:D-alanyl-D-alanine carboxypeptidase [Desulfovibrio sp.]
MPFFQRTFLSALLVLFALSLLCPHITQAARLPVKAAILYNMSTGKVLYQLNENQHIAPASLTKIMTLFLAFDQIQKRKLSLQKRVKISAQAATTRGSSMHLKRGERVPLSKLITGTAVASGNDAAIAVAQTVHPSLATFVKRMNAKAKALKMRQTVFKNPTGLPAQGQISCALDILKLSLAYVRTHPEALSFHELATFTHGGHVLTTTNPLLGAVCGVNGLKTGWTVASGYNIVVTAKRGNTRLMCVIMGGKSRVGRDLTARRLIEAGFKSPASAQGVREAIEGKNKKQAVSTKPQPLPKRQKSAKRQRRR